MLYKKYFKRLIDFVLSIIGLIIISPFLIIVWLLLTIVNRGGGAFFFQTRPGKDGKLFKVIKFKTMSDKRDSSGNLLPAKERITPIGRIIRSLSIDELPQLFNVINGDMSLIGPRPLRVEYLSLYSTRQAKRHDVRPGVSGWAQINGRNAISWEEKFELDVWYVENVSLWLDIKILFITIWNVISRKGINQNENSTMQPFKGAKLNG